MQRRRYGDSVAFSFQVAHSDGGKKVDWEEMYGEGIIFFKKLLVVCAEVLGAKVDEGAYFLREVAIGGVEDKESGLSGDVVLQDGEEAFMKDIVYC